MEPDFCNLSLSELSTTQEEVFALKVVCDLTVRHNTTILRTTILVNIHHFYRGLHWLLVRLGVYCPLKLSRGSFSALPEDRIFPERSFGNIAFLDTPFNVISVIIGMKISGFASFEECLGHLAFCISHVDFELLCFGLIRDTGDSVSAGFKR